MEEKTLDQLSLDGGCLVFDFTNTIGSRRDAQSKDYLQTFPDFLKWVDRLCVIPKKRLKQLTQFSSEQPTKVARSLNKIRDARETLYRLFSDLSLQKKPEKEVMEKFNSVLSESLSYIRLDIGLEKNEISFTGEEDALPEEPLRIILKSAFDVLTGEDPTRIKECSSCGWLFLDKTKNNKRRWCNMLDCGSKDKASRYYYRQKAVKSSQGKTRQISKT